LPHKTRKIKEMNRLILFVVVLGLAFTACKSKKELAQSPYTTDPSAQPKVFTVPASNTQAQPAPREEPAAV
jgi:hypothetical protein